MHSPCTLSAWKRSKLSESVIYRKSSRSSIFYSHIWLPSYYIYMLKVYQLKSPEVFTVSYSHVFKLCNESYKWNLKVLNIFLRIERLLIREIITYLFLLSWSPIRLFRFFSMKTFMSCSQSWKNVETLSSSAFIMRYILIRTLALTFEWSNNSILSLPLWTVDVWVVSICREMPLTHCKDLSKTIRMYVIRRLCNIRASAQQLLHHTGAEIRSTISLLEANVTLKKKYMFSWLRKWHLISIGQVISIKCGQTLIL